MKIVWTLGISLVLFLCACSTKEPPKTYVDKNEVIERAMSNIGEFNAIKDLIFENPNKYGEYLTIRYSRAENNIEFSYFQCCTGGGNGLTVDELYEGQTISAFMETYGCNDLSYETDEELLRLEFENASSNSGLLYTPGESDQYCVPIEGCEGWYYYAYPLDDT